MELLHAPCGHRDAEQGRPDDQPLFNERPLSELLDVMGELSGVLAVENELLRRGLPASLSDVAERKVDLTEKYTEIADDVVEDLSADPAVDPLLVGALGQAASRLQGLTEENLVRLETALSATRRRIDAVMEAVKAEYVSEQAALEHFVGFGGDYRA